MSKQSLNKVYKLLFFLKQNTDINHPATQANLRELAKIENAEDILGDKGTFTRRLTELADALNTDLNGKLLPQSKWKIIFPGYRNNDTSRNGKIYYRQPVSSFELEFLLQQIDSSLDFTSAEKLSLKKRLCEALSSKYFEQGSFPCNALVKTSEKEQHTQDFSLLEEKLSVIRKHILNKQMLELTVETDNAEMPEKRIRFSPYRIVQKGSSLWLIGNWHKRPQEEHPWPAYTDDLTAIDISNISSFNTAHTPDQTYIHWRSTNSLLPNQSYTRISDANRITKARYPEKIRNNLEKFDRLLPDLNFEHMKDINL